MIRKNGISKLLTRLCPQIVCNPRMLIPQCSNRGSRNIKAPPTVRLHNHHPLYRALVSNTKTSSRQHGILCATSIQHSFTTRPPKRFTGEPPSSKFREKTTYLPHPLSSPEHLPSISGFFSPSFFLFEAFCFLLGDSPESGSAFDDLSEPFRGSRASLKNQPTTN